jgi:hypothetical protein
MYPSLHSSFSMKSLEYTKQGNVLQETNEGKWDYMLARYKRKLKEKISDSETKIWQSEALKYLQESRKVSDKLHENI